MSSVAEQLAADTRLVHIATAVAVASAVTLTWLLWSTRARRTKAPLPPVDDYDTTDYVRRLVDHQPCEWYPCPHSEWRKRADATQSLFVTEHCRCGNPWVCDLAGPLNTTAYAAEPYNRQDDPGRGWWM